MKILRIRFQLFDETGLSKDRILSLKIIIWAVAVGSICFNIIGGVAITGYLKAIGVSDFLLGLLFAMGPIAGVLQFPASYLLERTRNRKRQFMLFGFISRSVWLPFGLIPFIIPESGQTLRIWLLSSLMLINAVCTPFMTVTFFSMFADIVPSNIRGRYLGIRMRIATVAVIFGGLLTAFLLDTLPGFYGYGFVFAIAAATGLIDIAMFVVVKFPAAAAAKRQDKLRMMLSEVLKNKRFVRVVGFITLWAISNGIAGPFYLVYARTTLGMSNTAITMIMQIVPNVCSIAALAMWGKAIDEYGSKPLMIIIGKATAIAPLLWVFVTPGSVLIVPIIIACAVISGIFIPGMEISAQNSFFASSSEKNRSMYVAVYFSITALAGLGLSNTLGGWLLDNPLSLAEAMNYSLFGIQFNRYNYLFLISFVLRIVVVFVLLPRMISEPDAKPASAAAAGMIRMFMPRRVKRGH